MSDLNQWPHRWFGVWAEFGPAYEQCPSVKSFVSVDVNRSYQKDKLRTYLATAPVVASTSRRSLPNPFTGERKEGGIAFRTDGKWLWLDDLSDYVDEHGVALPSAWIAEIIARNYLPPVSVTDDVIAQLEWPPTS